VFENRVLRMICGPKGDEETGEWRRLHNEELCDLYCLTNIIRNMNIKKNKKDGACGTQWEQERCINGFGVERSGKELLGRT
jgi:hypothetical protein